MGKRAIASMFCAAMIAVSMTGCGEAQDKDAELKTRIEEFKADMAETQVGDQKDNEGICIGSVNMGMNGEWYSEAMNGIWDAGEDLGVTVKMLDSDGSLEKETENIETLLDDGIDALVISTRDYEESVESIDKVLDAGIPVITWNTSADTDVTSFVCVDSKALGGDTGDYLCEYIKTYDLKDVNVIIIGNQNYDVGVARCDGFKEAIKTMINQGNVSIVAEDYAETFDASEELTEKLLNEHPEATAIWVWNQPSLLGAIEAVKRLGRTDIMVMGADMSMELADDMLGDEVNLLSVTTQMPYNMGYESVVTAVKAIHGEHVDKNVLIPLFTYTKGDRELIERYIKANEGLVEFEGGQWYE